MSSLGWLKRGVKRAGRLSVANPVVRSITATTGLQGRFHTLYWRAMLRAHGGTTTKPVDGVEITMHAWTPDEFRHCHTLMGERAIIEDVRAHVEPDDVFFDVGAYLGVYSCAVAAGRPSVRSVAFEPDPRRRRRLAENLEANDVDADLRDCVLADEVGTVPFAVSDGVEGPNCSRVATSADNGTIEVEQTTVDRLVDSAAVPVPNAVKVDVEGAELATLRGMTATLERPACRVVHCEVHPSLLPTYGGSGDDVRDVLTTAGFEVTRIGDRGEEYFLRATKPP